MYVDTHLGWEIKILKWAEWIEWEKEKQNESPWMVRMGTQNDKYHKHEFSWK